MRISFSNKLIAAIAAGVAILVVLGAIAALKLTYIGIGLGIALLIWIIFMVNRYESNRRRSESALFEHDQRLKLALELAAIVGWDWDVATDKFVWNDDPQRLLGPAPDGGYPDRKQMVHPEDSAEFVRAGSESLRSGEAYRAEFRILRTDGQVVWIAARGRPVKDARGAVTRMIGVSQDVSELKQAEQALRESETRFRSLTELSSDWYWEQDRELRLSFHSSGFAQRSGTTSNKLLGKRRWEEPNRFPLSGTWDEHRATLEAHQPFRDFEYVRIAADGEQFFVSLSGVPIYDAAGQFNGYRGVGTNITERKRAEQALRESETELRLVTNAVPAVISYADTEERMRFCNDTMVRLIGRPREMILNRTMRDIFGEDRYRQLEPHVRRALAGEEAHFERTQVKADGDLLDLSVKYLPRRNESGAVEGFYTLATDITEIRRLERLKSEFVSTVSHELRTPLTSIRGSLGLLSGGVGGALPDKARGLIEIAKSNCERLIRLINDMLDIEKIESGKMTFNLRPLALMELIEQVARANDGFADQHGVRLQVTAAVPGAKVQADGDRLVQVLTNLISNACKFSPVGRSVDIAVARRGERLRVEVADHGPGISYEFRQRIFQKFSQADASTTRQEGGTGLGLSISKAIIERLGGEIGFFSEPGKGATFYFELPEWRGESLSTPVAPVLPGAPDAPDGRPRVLVCEDDPDVAKLIQLMLQNAGLASDIAYDAAEAKALLLSRRYAAMTLDLMLPDQDGLSLIRELRTAPGMAHLPVIVVSATAEEGKLKLHGENLEVIDWIGKPIDESRLLANLRQVQGAARLRVLHVEDDPDLRRVVSTIARDVADFVPAESVGDATAKLARERFDMVLLDLGLPDGSGWELLQLINRLTPRPRVVIFSAHDEQADRGQGADPFLVKSQTSDQQLLDTIRGAFNAAA
jgi:PAS domain S-box-containing protein